MRSNVGRKYVWRDGKMLDITDGDPGAKKKEAHSVIQDSMDALLHPLPGERIDSKSEFERTTKANGGVCLGNEDPIKAQKSVVGNKPKPTGIGAVVAKNYEILEQCPSEVPEERREEWFRDVIKER